MSGNYLAAFRASSLKGGCGREFSGQGGGNLLVPAFSANRIVSPLVELPDGLNLRSANARISADKRKLQRQRSGGNDPVRHVRNVVPTARLETSDVKRTPL